MQITDVQDKIGVVRQHRWISATEQERILQPRCRIVVSLGGGKSKQVTREDLEKLTRPGTVIEFVHSFLLADPRKKRIVGGMKADYKAAMDRLTKKRGGVVSDLDSGLSTEEEGHRKAMQALAEDQIARSNKGLRSALNGARSKGRPTADFTPQQEKDARAIWRDRIEYPSWEAADAALRQIVSPNGVKFTADRAYDKWKRRT